MTFVVFRMGQKMLDEHGAILPFIGIDDANDESVFISARIEDLTPLVLIGGRIIRTDIVQALPAC
jgi:hypothetical protein